MALNKKAAKIFAAFKQALYSPIKINEDLVLHNWVKFFGMVDPIFNLFQTRNLAH